MAKKSINIQLPFQNSNKGGVFGTNSVTSQALTDDLLSLMTTKRGARVMRSGVYSPIFDYLFEPIDDITQQNLTKDIQNQVKKYLPQIDVLQVRMDLSEEDDNILVIKILFTSKTIYNINQTLVISVPINEGNIQSN